MAEINRYFDYNPGEYVHTYTPYNIGEMLRMGAIKEERDDKALAKLDEVEGLRASILNAPGHSNYAQRVLKPFDDKLKEISAMDVSDPNMIRETRKLKSSLLTNPDVKNILTSKEAYDKRWSAIMNDPRNKSAIYNMPGVLDDNNQFIENETSYNNLDYTPYADYDKHIDDYLKDVEYKVAKKSGYNTFKDKKTGLLMLSTAKGAVKVRELPEFQQAIEGLTETFMNPNKPETQYFSASTKKIYGEDAYNEDYTKEYITNRARRFFNTQDLSETDYDIIPGQFDQDKADDQNKMITTSQTSALPNQIDTSTEENLFKRAKFLSGVLQKQKAEEEAIPTGEGVSYGYPKGTQEDLDKIYNEQKAFLNNIRKSQPALNYIYKPDGKGYKIQRAATEEEILGFWNEAKEDLKVRSSNKLNPSPDALDDLTSKIFGPEGVGDFENRHVTAIIDGQQITGTSDIIAKALGYSNGVIPIDVRSKSRVIGINQMGSTPGEYVAKVANSEGAPVTITVNADNEIQDIMRTSHGLMQLISKGESGEVYDEKTNLTYHVQSKVHPITKKFVPKIIVEDKDTKEMEEISLEKLLETEKNVLLNSGYVGTVLGAQKANKP